jgi:hypothetical protein
MRDIPSDKVLAFPIINPKQFNLSFTQNKKFKQELESLINRYSLENGSDTPDFILAQYLVDCLKVYARIARRRDKWYGYKTLTNRVTAKKLDMENDMNRDE